MARNPLFWVLVRNYRLLDTKLVVQSPHVDVKAPVSRVIIRPIDGEYMGEPRVVDDVKKLRDDDIDGKIYHHAAHGVCISLEPHADKFPVWVCLKRNENCQENHVWVLNLYNLEFSVVSIANICWVPSHEATNGDLYTIIGDPGRHGYQITRLPAIVQNLGIPRQAKFGFLPTSLSGFRKLEPRRQQELFDHQHLNMKKGSRRCPRLGHLNLYSLGQRQRSHTATDGSSELPDFCQDSFPPSEKERTTPLFQNQFRGIQKPVPEGSCRCFCRYPDLGPTCLNPYPLHRHVTDTQCSLGSMHPLHCVFADHRPEHCVISGSMQEHNHKHCVTGGTHLTIVDFPSANFEHQAASTNTGVNHAVVADETDIELGDHVDDESLYDELELLAGQPWFLEDQAMQTWSNLDIPMPYPESRQNSPVIGFFPDIHDDRESADLLGPVLDSTTYQGTGWIQPVIDSHFLITTPEPREMRR